MNSIHTTFNKGEVTRDTLLQPSFDLLLENIDRTLLLIQVLGDHQTKNLKIDHYNKYIVPKLKNIDIILGFISRNEMDFNITNYNTHGKYQNLITNLNNIDKEIKTNYTQYLNISESYSLEGDMGEMAPEIAELFGNQDFGSQIGALNG